MNMLKLYNGVEMPELGFGTFKSADACAASTACAIKAGYRLLDTAQAYGNEAEVGEGIRMSGIDRRELFITTKVHIANYGEGRTRQSVEESLRRLGTDYLDLVLLHWPFGDTYAAWRDLETLYKEGVIRAIGVSNFESDRLLDFIYHNEIKPAVNQVEMHLLCQRKEEREWMEKEGVICQAYMPLGRGRGPAMFEAEAVRAAAEKYHKTPAQIALKFLLQSHAGIIPKSVHEERIRENIDLYDFTLSEEEMTALSLLDEKKAFVGNPSDPNKVMEALKW